MATGQFARRPSPEAAPVGSGSNPASGASAFGHQESRSRDDSGESIAAMPTGLFEELRAILARNGSSEDRQFDAGGQLIRPLPWISPNAWLHRVMAPCPDAAIAELATTTGRQPPAAYVELLRAANGLDLFNKSLKVYGVRGDFSRDPAMALLLPYDVADATREAERHLKRDDFLVGSVGPNVDLCVWRSSSGQIERLARKTGEPLGQWPSLRDWLIGEAERYFSLHHSDGRLRENALTGTGDAPPWPQEPLYVPKPRVNSSAWRWDVEDRLGLPARSLPFHWLGRVRLGFMVRLEKWLKRLD